MKMRTLVLMLLLSGVSGAATQSACAKAPPTLSPAGVSAFNNHRVQRALDIIRDTAQDANAQTPPVLSTDTTRKVTRWHESAITIVHAMVNGWQVLLTTSLDELLKDVPAHERPMLAPYVALAKTVITQVSK